jgi:ankyrin repeat protein
VRLEDLTLLHHIAFSGNIEALSALAEVPYFKEVVDESANEQGWTPLLWAATKKHMTIVKLLVESGATLLKPKADGMTILHVAASQNDIHMLDYTIKTLSYSTEEAVSGEFIDMQNTDVGKEN